MEITDLLKQMKENDNKSSVEENKPIHHVQDSLRKSKLTDKQKFIRSLIGRRR